MVRAGVREQYRPLRAAVPDRRQQFQSCPDFALGIRAPVYELGDVIGRQRRKLDGSRLPVERAGSVRKRRTGSLYRNGFMLASGERMLWRSTLFDAESHSAILRIEVLGGVVRWTAVADATALPEGGGRTWIGGNRCR